MGSREEGHARGKRFKDAVRNISPTQERGEMGFYWRGKGERKNRVQVW